MNGVAKDYFPEATVQILDALTYTTAAFRKSYPATYLFLAGRCPWLWGLFFNTLDNRVVDKIARIQRRFNNLIHCQGLEQFILDEKPDIIITTHWLPNEVVSHLKKRHPFKALLVTCITDYYPHAFWRDSGVDLYFAPHADLTVRLKQLGILENKIKVTGLPIDKVFGVRIEKVIIRAKLGLAKEKPTVLIASGGFGIGPVAELVAEVNKIERSLQILVICGNNSKLQDRLYEVAKRSHHQIKIFGFVNNMHELMDASDLMISKPGGLTTTEAMAKALPLIILDPIPGQETYNSEFLIKHQAGIEAKNPAHARLIIEQLLVEPERLKHLTENISQLAKPHAAQEIMTIIKKRFESGRAE